MNQGLYYSVIGVFRPANLPSWWSETNYLYAFRTYTGSSSTYFTSGVNQLFPSSSNPFNISNNSYPLQWMYSTAFANFNPNNSNNYDIVTGLVLCQPTAGGYIAGSAGTTSSDLCFGSAYNKNILDVWSVGSQQYTLLSSPSILNGVAFGIRTA
jgi:hypothetical protein